jgi:hypothetical protein
VLYLPGRVRWRKRIIVFGRQMPFTLRCTLNPSVDPLGQCVWAIIIARLGIFGKGFSLGVDWFAREIQQTILNL